jgi:hypothetical protein
MIKHEIIVFEGRASIRSSVRAPENGATVLAPFLNQETIPADVAFSDYLVAITEIHEEKLVRTVGQYWIDGDRS